MYTSVRRLKASTLNSRLVIPNLFRDLLCFNVCKGFTLFILVILGKILKRVQDDILGIGCEHSKPSCTGLRFRIFVGQVCPTYSIGSGLRIWLTHFSACEIKDFYATLRFASVATAAIDCLNVNAQRIDIHRTGLRIKNL